MIRVVVDDLAFVEADAVVRPATASLEPTVPGLRRLDQVGGPGFWDHAQLHGELAPGAAVVTPAGDLPCEFVIHAIIRSATESVSAATVRRALTSVLQRAADWQLAHLTVPPLGTGAGNLSAEAAADAMCAVLRECLGRTAYPKHVTIVVETEDEKQVFDARVARITL